MCQQGKQIVVAHAQGFANRSVQLSLPLYGPIRITLSPAAIQTDVEVTEDAQMQMLPAKELPGIRCKPSLMTLMIYCDSCNS